MHFDIAWQEVDTVLLDMDGTLLDLAFDNYFWQKLVPETYGAKLGISPQAAQAAIAWTTGASAWVWIFVP